MKDWIKKILRALKEFFRIGYTRARDEALFMELARLQNMTTDILSLLSKDRWRHTSGGDAYAPILAPENISELMVELRDELARAKKKKLPSKKRLDSGPRPK